MTNKVFNSFRVLEFDKTNRLFVLSNSIEYKVNFINVTKHLHNNKIIKVYGKEKTIGCLDRKRVFG